MTQPTERDQARRPVLRRPVTMILAAVLLVLLVVGLWAFQPWKAFTRSTLDEALPTVDAPAAPAKPAAPADPTDPTDPAEPVVLAEGEFVSQEHETTGVAKIVELPDGSRYVRLENFSTSDGPDVHVWLTDQSAGGDWFKYEDGRYLALGRMRATDGNQNYPIPADADLTGFTSVVIWCDRFNVSFGSAPVTL